MSPHRFLFVIAIVVASATRSLAAQGFHWDSNVFYQPDEPLRARLGAAEEVAAYMKRIDAACTAFFASEKTPERLDIVVGVKPERKVRVWFVSSRRTSQDKTLVALRKKLEAIPPCTVHDGPIAFALRGTIAGGGAAPKQTGEYQPPSPKEWRAAAAKGPVVVPDGIFERIWRD